MIRVMFPAFPYLFWQALAYWSGFFVGMIVAVVLTAMFNRLLRREYWKKDRFCPSSSIYLCYQVVEHNVLS